MRNYLFVLCLLLLSLPRVVQAREWDLATNAGIGVFFGTGWDANRAGGSLSVSGGPRLHRVFSVHAMLLMQGLRWRTEDDARKDGEFFSLMLAPEIHPLGRRDGITPYLAPLVGYSYQIGRVDEPGAEVKYASRAAVVGGMLGCTWPLTRSYLLGANFLFVRMLGGQSCMESDAGGTTCGSLEKNSTSAGAAQVTFQMIFGSPKTKAGGK